VKATAEGLVLTGFVATTVLLNVLITETVPPLLFVTQACNPLGLMAIPVDLSPTVTVVTNLLVAVAITETVLSPKFVT
jgi:hypothetical protein